MAGCFGNHPEDRARENELNRYLDAQDAAENRELAIAEEAEELMKPGKECDPHLVHIEMLGQVAVAVQRFHFSEAIAEMPDPVMAVVNGLFAKALRTKLHCDYTEAAVKLSEAVCAYWEGQAKAVAERRMK